MQTITQTKTLLLNPPGKKKYFRDYYCAKVSKAKYYYHPIDLVYLSGTISQVCQVFIIDAIADNSSESECLAHILKIKPNNIIFLSSAPSVNEDLIFIENVKQKLVDVKIIGTGDIIRENSYEFLKQNPIIDATISDFSNNGIVEFLSINPIHALINVSYRNNNQIIHEKKEKTKPLYSIPIPLWELFTKINYTFPFSKHKRFASVLTDYGCPYNCDFCPIGNIEFRLRPIENVIEELNLLKRLNIKELYIRDQTFGINKKRTLELLGRIIQENFRFSWTCLSRLDTIDEELLYSMKEAGCHTIMLGIESANNNLLRTHNKSTDITKTYEIIKTIKKFKFRVGGFFMIGFPDEDMVSINNTISFACSLNIDYASFNIVTPRHGTEFRLNAVANGLLSADSTTESSDSVPEWNKAIIQPNLLLSVKKSAVRKFYLRPKFILNQVFRKRTLWEVKSILIQSIELLRRNK